MKFFYKLFLSKLLKRPNKDKHHKADEKHFWVVVKDGSEVIVLALTDHELERSRQRAKDNKEDCPKYWRDEL